MVGWRGAERRKRGRIGGKRRKRAKTELDESREVIMRRANGDCDKPPTSGMQGRRLRERKERI